MHYKLRISEILHLNRRIDIAMKRRVLQEMFMDSGEFFLSASKLNFVDVYISTGTFRKRL